MTLQIPDLFLYNGAEYHVAGISEETLFEPASVGLSPAWATTACYRGYQAIYSLTNECLVLETLSAKLLAKEGESYRPLVGREINGVKATQSKEQLRFSWCFNNIYEHINIFLKYSGGIFIAIGARSTVVAGGFPHFFGYRGVIELIFEDGVLKGVTEVRSVQLENLGNINNGYNWRPIRRR